MSNLQNRMKKKTLLMEETTKKKAIQKALTGFVNVHMKKKNIRFK